MGLKQLRLQGDIGFIMLPILRTPIMFNIFLVLHELSQLHILALQVSAKVCASAGNRTRAARVAGEHSTTKPPMLTQLPAMTL